MKNERTYNTTLAIEIGVYLLLKGGLVHITRADSDTEGNSLLLSLSSNVLPHGDGRVDATSLLKESADGASRTLGGDEDNIHIFGGDDVGVVLKHDGETMGEVEGLSLGNERRNRWPCLRLGGIGQKVHDDSTLVDSLLDGEKSLAGDPAVFQGLSPALTILADTNDDVKAIITGV
jgi:hypothetical protein